MPSFINGAKNPAAQDFIADAVGNLKRMENAVMGPEIDYTAAVPKPAELGVGIKNTSLNQTMRNMTAASTYVDVLAFGSIGPGTDVVAGLPFGPGASSQRSSASKYVKPLGVRQFMPTGAKCPNAGLTDKDKMVWIDTVPTGRVLGESVREGIAGVFGGKTDPSFGLRGLGPGVVGDVMSLNPMPVLSAMVGTNAPCMRVRAPVMVTSAEMARGVNGKIVDDINRQGAGKVAGAKTDQVPPVRDGLYDWQRMGEDCDAGRAGLCETNQIEDDGTGGYRPRAKEGFVGSSQDDVGVGLMITGVLMAGLVGLRMM